MASKRTASKRKASNSSNRTATGGTRTPPRRRRTPTAKQKAMISRAKKELKDKKGIQVVGESFARGQMKKAPSPKAGLVKGTGKFKRSGGDPKIQKKRTGSIPNKAKPKAKPGKRKKATISA